MYVILLDVLCVCLSKKQGSGNFSYTVGCIHCESPHVVDANVILPKRRWFKIGKIRVFALHLDPV